MCKYYLSLILVVLICSQSFADVVENCVKKDDAHFTCTRTITVTTIETIPVAVFEKRIQSAKTSLAAQQAEISKKEQTLADVKAVSEIKNP